MAVRENNFVRTLYHRLSRAYVHSIRKLAHTKNLGRREWSFDGEKSKAGPPSRYQGGRARRFKVLAAPSTNTTWQTRNNPREGFTFDLLR